LAAGDTRSPNLTGRNRHRSLRYAGRKVVVLATSEETGGRFSLVEEFAWKSTSLALPLWIQTREFVCSYVIAGELTVQVGAEVFRVSPGACIAVPPGVSHHYQVDSDAVHVINLYVPAGFEGFFRDLGELAESPTSATEPDAPLDIERLVGIAAKYGVEIVAPTPND
jgi:mannose-6-phosphate isomerase-like protein (cupin superfamily)